MTAAGGTALQRADGAKAIADRIEGKLVEMEERIAAFCPPGMTPASVRHSVMMALGSNRKLLEARWETVVMAAVVITQWGLEIGRTAHIVPYKGVATPVADYKGYVELILATRLVKHVNAKEIRAADHFEYHEGDHPLIVHRPHWTDKHGPIIGAYCSIPTVAGGVIQEVLNVDEIEAIRRTSHQWGPDKVRELPVWYARKTAIRRAAKMAPKSPRLALLHRFETDAGDVSEEALDTLASGEIARLPEIASGEPPRPAPAIAPPANGYGIADDAEVLL